MPDRNLHLPELPLPEPLRGTDRGSFAEYTVARRMPAIARRVPEENQLDSESAARVQALIDELPDAPVRALDEPHAPDEAAWNREVAAVQGQSWLEVPWFFAETFFYRRIVEAVGYFTGNGSSGLDPFHYQKRRGLEVTEPQIATAFDELGHAIGGGWQVETFQRLLNADLWGNQVDLSLWPADDQNHPSHAAEDADAHLLVDDAAEAAGHLAHRAPGFQLDILVDNAGFELIGDLVLADYLLSTRAAGRVVLHVKIHPTFVSDATVADVRETVSILGASTHQATRDGAVRLTQHLEAGRLRLRDHAFWTSPLPAWEMPPDVRIALAASDLVVSKGDANYRRLLGDLHWPLETPFDGIVSYLPAPLVALRTYKSEVGCGLTAARIAELDGAEPDWRTNGRWGIIQASGLDAVYRHNGYGDAASAVDTSSP